jgi:glutathione S-transferase
LHLTLRCRTSRG